MIIDERGPKHIAIILDGNRRWAKAKGLKPTEGHKAGAEAVKNIAKYAYDCGLKYLTVYAFSTENWKRDAQEVNLLMRLLDKFTSDLLVSDEKREIKIKVYGDISALDKKLQEKIIKLENELNDYLHNERKFVDIFFSITLGVKKDLCVMITRKQ